MNFTIPLYRENVYKLPGLPEIRPGKSLTIILMPATVHEHGFGMANNCHHVHSLNVLIFDTNLSSEMFTDPFHDFSMYSIWSQSIENPPGENGYTERTRYH